MCCTSTNVTIAIASDRLPPRITGDGGAGARLLLAGNLDYRPDLRQPQFSGRILTALVRSLAREESGGGLIAVRMTSGMQGGVTLHLALARNVGTCRPDAKGEIQTGGPREDESYRPTGRLSSRRSSSILKSSDAQASSQRLNEITVLYPVHLTMLYLAG
jgi:hypothetical protein